METVDAEKTVISLVAASWSEFAQHCLRATGAAHLPEYYRQYQNGAGLFEVVADGARVGVVLLRIDVLGSGAEGVIVAAAAHVPGVDMTEAVLPAIEGMFRGVDRIRIHTARPGLAKKLNKSGYRAQEVVMVKEVKSCIYH